MFVLSFLSRPLTRLRLHLHRLTCSSPGQKTLTIGHGAWTPGYRSKGLVRSQTQLQLCGDGIGSRLNPSRPRESELASHSHALASPAPGVCFASRGWVMVVVGVVGGVSEPAPLVAVSKVAALALEDMGLRQRRRVLGSRASVAVRLNCPAHTVLKPPAPHPVRLEGCRQTSSASCRRPFRLRRQSRG